ncbi:probable polyketide synthase 1-like protein, putative [Babesia ovata]|uniref:Probable polyketide synthase 1-like protein, putative n=1 Tax=Babesia ovata TaxID=189622 RepID=A0A2H6KKG3_9APIC|nr:probable polyketide synthase 1-like protein, putative [Babesia ovata]GBE63479.1 probable polyketide synthase 1-like protein, putative [Babesia ovata]
MILRCQSWLSWRRNNFLNFSQRIFTCAFHPLQHPLHARDCVPRDYVLHFPQLLVDERAQGLEVGGVGGGEEGVDGICEGGEGCFDLLEEGIFKLFNAVLRNPLCRSSRFVDRIDCFI